MSHEQNPTPSRDPLKATLEHYGVPPTRENQVALNEAGHEKPKPHNETRHAEVEADLPAPEPVV